MVWLAKLRCVVFWFKVLTSPMYDKRLLTSPMYDKRLLRRMATESVQHGKGSWVRKMASCCRDFDWENVGQPQMQNLSETELRGMLESVAQRKVKGEVEKGIGEETEVVDQLCRPSSWNGGKSRNVLE